ncbi:MAG: SDR family NAD-dependent epimerase/dehydratase [Candidatus Omnitrophota bacterium]|nr:MAG: SDR family NAD-dependent epimerase/dehydratase [Candidatus Omnitrophota bacterium]
MKILITGGAGFIGSHLCKFYLERGNEVWCIDNLSTGDIENIEELFKNPDFKFLKKDLINLDIDKLPTDFDFIIHLASPASPSDYFKYPVETLKVNSIGTEKMLLLALRCDAKFLFSSTSEVYGDPLIPVQNEEYWGNVNPVGERSPYDEGKRFGEAITMAYKRKYNVNTRIVRIFNTYGPKMRIDDGRVIPNFICQAIRNLPITIYGDGEQTRSFCYIDDLVDGIARIMEKDYHLPINLGNPEEFSILQLAKIIKELTSSDSPIVFKPPLPDDPKRRKPDITKAQKILGWKPKISLEEGLKKTITYFERKLK